MRPWLALVAVVLAGLAAEAALPPLEDSTDRPGADYQDFALATGAGPGVCRISCINDTNCEAFTYVNAGVAGEKPRCRLKKAVPAPVEDACCVSGVKRSRR